MTKSRAAVYAILAAGFALLSTPTSARAAAFVVNPGESVQAAIDGAADGDVIKVMPGDYTETHGGPDAILVTKRLKLIARNSSLGNVRILPGPGNLNGIVVRGAEGALVERVLIKGFIVEGFTNHGIWLEYANKFKIKNNTSANNLHNGIFPTLWGNGLVKNNVSFGALDAGLWVEASENVRVINNEVHTNPTGIELTVSRNVLVKGNDIYNHGVGLGLYHPNGASLPPLGDDGDWDIIGNDIHDNNLPNPVVGGLVGQLPSGIGALVIGVDRVTMLKNTITGNDFTGISVVNWCDFNDCVADPPVVDQRSDNNSFIRNTVTGNGLNPDPDFPFSFLASDVVVFAPGSTGNCFSDNVTNVTIPTPLSPEC